MKKKIIIIAGDPNSINSEIISKIWKVISPSVKKKIYLIANFNLINKQFKRIKSKTSIVKVKQIKENSVTKKLKIIDIPLNFKNPFKVSLKNSTKYIIGCFNLAHKLAENNEVGGLINCPINKKLLHKSKKIGVTEFLASKCKINNGSEVMLIHNKKLSVVPLTTHINIKNVSKKININLIIKKMTTLRKDFKKLFNKSPKIGILGLNPHNAELASNSEEIKIINPAISRLKKKGFYIKGPLSADTLFINNYKKYDVIVGMYHDQVLTPFKSLFHFDAINITLGLNYLRVSPDHGPAKDIINKNKANPLSLLKCVKFINSLN
jgi:4-hydroxythreonine-4-phosphate dehydrogenase